MILNGDSLLKTLSIPCGVLPFHSGPATRYVPPEFPVALEPI